MTGRAEVVRLQAQLGATFERARRLAATADAETQSDFARYLCISVSGFLEKSVAELVIEHSRRSGGPTLQRFIEANTRKFTNANSEKLKQLLGSFSQDWRLKLEAILVDDAKDAIDSIIGLRHSIAHGGSAGVTYSRVSEYYKRIQLVIEQIADICTQITQVAEHVKRNPKILLPRRFNGRTALVYFGSQVQREESQRHRLRCDK